MLFKIRPPGIDSQLTFYFRVNGKVATTTASIHCISRLILIKSLAKLQLSETHRTNMLAIKYDIEYVGTVQVNPPHLMSMRPAGDSTAPFHSIGDLLRFPFPDVAKLQILKHFELVRSGGSKASSRQVNRARKDTVKLPPDPDNQQVTLQVFVSSQ